MFLLCFCQTTKTQLLLSVFVIWMNWLFKNHLTNISIDTTHCIKITPIAVAHAAVHPSKERPREGCSDSVHNTAIWWWNETLHLALIRTACASWWFTCLYMKWLITYMKPDPRQMKLSCLCGSCTPISFTACSSHYLQASVISMLKPDEYIKLCDLPALYY